MFSVQPILLWRYIGFKRNKIPGNLRRLFYLSWEDAFWDLLDKKNVAKKSYILVPNFYCADVEKNINNRGFKIVRYPILKNMTVSEGKFRSLVNRFNPKVVIVFHPVGIKSNLFKNTKWIESMSDDILLIEDSVHRIVNPNNLKILKKNHYVIDSLRKVVPMQGANIYGLRSDLNYYPPVFYQSIFYSIFVHSLWFFMTLSLNFRVYKFAEKMMIKGYDLIGDAKKPAKGFVLFKHLYEFLNYKKIYKIKNHQVKIYESYFGKYVEYENPDRKELRGYPVILNNNHAERIIKNVRNLGLMIRFELNDSEWSRDNKIVYLPLGPYLADNEVREISKLVLKSFEHE